MIVDDCTNFLINARLSLFLSILFKLFESIALEEKLLTIIRKTISEIKLENIFLFFIIEEILSLKYLYLLIIIAFEELNYIFNFPFFHGRNRNRDRRKIIYTMCKHKIIS